MQRDVDSGQRRGVPGYGDAVMTVQQLADAVSDLAALLETLAANHLNPVEQQGVIAGARDIRRRVDKLAATEQEGA